MNKLIHFEWTKAVISDRNIRIHHPMPLYNPFKQSERITLAESLSAYEGWLRGRIINGDKLIVAEMERIAGYLTDKSGKDVGLIGSKDEYNVIKRIIDEALSQ